MIIIVCHHKKYPLHFLKDQRMKKFSWAKIIEKTKKKENWKIYYYFKCGKRKPYLEITKIVLWWVWENEKAIGKIS